MAILLRRMARKVDAAGTREDLKTSTMEEDMTTEDPSEEDLEDQEDLSGGCR